MTRKIGSFNNPFTGETDWLVPDTVKELSILSQQICDVKSETKQEIGFELTNDNDKKVIILTGKTHGYSCSRELDELLFATELSKALYEEKTIEESDFMKKVISDIRKDLCKNIEINSGIFMQENQYDGIGFISSNGVKAITIEKISFGKVDYSSNQVEITLHDCTGPSILKNISNPVVSFYTKDHELSIPVSNIKSEGLGSLREYVLQISVLDIIATESKENIEYEVFEDINIDNEEAVQKFLASRGKLINSGYVDQDQTEDYFDDIL